MISFDDVYRWFNFFEGSSLTWPVIFLRDLALQKINERKFTAAYQLIEYLETYQNAIDDKYEKGEIWLECAMAYYEIRNLLQAVNSIMMAKKVFSEAAAGSHKCAVISWMLGTIQWETEVGTPKALKNWKGAIEDFDLLRRIADDERRYDDGDWYAERINEMEESLEERILGKFP